MTLKDEERKALIDHHIRKSYESVENTDFLIKNEKLFLAANQIYYGIYYILSALAIKNEFSTSKHLQLIGWFNKTFVKQGFIDKKYSKIITKAYENRMKGDYDVFSEFSEEMVKQSFEEMRDVIGQVEKLI